jgi:sporulation protein YlmC with PRC-barrel domain
MSNNFIVKFTAPTTVPTPSPSGGGSRKIPISLKIIIPEPISIYQKDRIIVPITLYNNGEIDLTGIILTSTIAKDNLIRDDIVVSFDKSHFSSLVQGQKENVTLTIDVNTSQTGLFEVTIHANVTNPEYYDWGKLYLTVKEGESILEKLLFAEEFIAENPECVELTEIVREADKYFEERDFTNALLKINHAIDACKNSISQPGRAKIREKTSNKFYDYLLLAMLACFFIGTFYYIYKRIRLKRVLLNDAAKSRNNKFNRTFLVICIGLIGFFAIKTSMAGFVISNLFSENQDKFNLSFIFILGFLGFFLFLHRKNIKKIIRNVKRKNHFGNNLNGLIKKKIYTSSGDYIGKIDNIILKKNKIHSLKIKLDNRAKQISKIKHKGIIVDYNQIKSVGHILLFKGGILKLKRALVKPL